MAFGAFVEILPGKEGLVHISELANYRVGKRRGRGQHRRRGQGGRHRDRSPGPDQPLAPALLEPGEGEAPRGLGEGGDGEDGGRARRAVKAASATARRGVSGGFGGGDPWPAS